jgi:hypothetical protein
MLLITFASVYASCCNSIVTLYKRCVTNRFPFAHAVYTRYY